MVNFYCEYCGRKFSSVQELTNQNCANHPSGFCKGKHKLYEGSEKTMYTCKYCGKQFRTIQEMTNINCSGHPNGFCKGKHSPAL